MTLLQLWHAYFHLGDVSALLFDYDDAVSFLSAAAAQAEMDGHDVAVARARLYTVAVDYHGQLKKTPPRADNLAQALTVHE